MKTIGSKHRLCFLGWILAAFLLVWFNGLEFLAVGNQPLMSESPVLRSLRPKLSRLGNKAVDNAAYGVDQLNSDTLFAAYRSPRIPAAAQERTSQAGTPPEPAGQANLPALSGIMQIEHRPGAFVYRAVLNGRVCNTQDQVQGFVIDTITPEGVSLRRLNTIYFIESPTPYFTSDHGR